MLFADPDAPAGSTLCGAGKVDVAPAYGTSTAILTELAGDPDEVVGSWTPTATSLQAAGAALAASGLDGRFYVILITDGAPNCNAGLAGATCECVGADPDSCASQPKLCMDDDRTVAAITDLAGVGISTFVIGYDTSVWAPVLDRMAAAGGTSYTTHVEVTDQASLVTALGEIAGGLLSCTYELADAPGDYHYVRVVIDGHDVPHESVHPSGPGSGWRLVGDRTVEILGIECDALRLEGEHDVTITRECDPVVL
jgi:hypothetical protein